MRGDFKKMRFVIVLLDDIIVRVGGEREMKEEFVIVLLGGIENGGKDEERCRANRYYHIDLCGL